MSNEEILSYLIVSGRIDLTIYNDKKFNKDIFKLLMANKEIWDLNKTLDYANKIAKKHIIIDKNKMISTCVSEELSGNVLFTKTLYNTLNFDIIDWANKLKMDNYTGEFVGIKIFEGNIKRKITSLGLKDETIENLRVDLAGFWRVVMVNIIGNTITHGSADGKGFHAAKFDGSNKSSLDYYNMNNLGEYKKFREKDYFISF